MPKPVPPLKSMALGLLRQTAGWSQAELAAAAGFSSGQISHFEQGRPAPPRDKLTELAAAMGHDEGAIDVALLALAALVGPASGRRAEEGAEGGRGGGAGGAIGGLDAVGAIGGMGAIGGPGGGGEAGGGEGVDVVGVPRVRRGSVNS